jgi:hypothetical protein
MAGGVEDDGSRTGGALVDGQQVFAHDAPSIAPLSRVGAGLAILP